jgi:hypothetical protein
MGAGEEKELVCGGFWKESPPDGDVEEADAGFLPVRVSQIVMMSARR